MIFRVAEDHRFSKNDPQNLIFPEILIESIGGIHRVDFEHSVGTDHFRSSVSLSQKAKDL